MNGQRTTNHGRNVAGRVLAVAALLLASLPMAAAAQVPADTADYRASATGAVIHAEGLEQPELSDPTSDRIVDADVAFSGAAVDSAGLPENQTTEYGGTFQPGETADGTAVAGQNAYGRGYALDVSLGQTGEEQGQLTLAGLAEAVAPPPTELIVEEAGPVPGDPFAFATLIRGEAEALYAADRLAGCVSLGSHLSYGSGLAANVQLVDTDGTPDEEGESEQLEQPLVSAQDTSRSLSHTFFAAQTDAEGERVGDALAVVAETRQTIAPVTLFSGTENEFTLEFLGEWVLRAVATGVPGTARVHYGPGEVSPETPLVRIVQVDGSETILTTQDLFGEEGLEIDGLPLAGISIGEDPRAIGGASDSEPTVSGDGTSASAAVDVVRIRLLSEEGTGEAGEIRIGHMEVSATAPAGGVSCADTIPVSKTASADSVEAGETFTYTITVDNPYQCPLTAVRIVDTITADSGVTWSVDGAEPDAASLSDGEVIWEGLGPIEPGGSLSVEITVTVGEDTSAGTITDEVAVTARCEGGPIAGDTDVVTDTTVSGGVVLQAPAVAGDGVVAGETLPATGGGALAIAGLALLGLVGVLRRPGS